MPITYIPLFFEKNDPCFAMWLWHYTTDWTRSGCLTCTWRLTWGLVDDPIRLLGKRAEALLKGVFSFMDPGRPNILGSCCTTATSRRRSTQLYFQEFSMIILNEGKKKWTTWGTVFNYLLTFVPWLEKERCNDSDAISSDFCCMLGLEKKKEDLYGSGHNSDVCGLWGGFPSSTGNSPIPAPCPASLLNSDTIYLETESDCTG